VNATVEQQWIPQPFQSQPSRLKLPLEDVDRAAYGLTVMQQLKVKPMTPRMKKSAARLTPRQLRRLAERMVASNDPAEVARLKRELERGFYGDSAHA
jgi:hypothetical protein